jgi:hypothetical protein
VQHIRDLEHAPVGKLPLGLVGVEQGVWRGATHDEGKLSRNVGGVHQGGVESFAGDRARKVCSITHQEAAPIGEPPRHPFVHDEI